MSATTPRRGLGHRGRAAVALLYGAVCHLAFAAGVLTMMAAMFFGMSRSLGNVAPPWNWLVNLALLAQFPLGHSILLTRRGRALLSRLGPRGTGTTLSTTTYVTLASLQVFTLFAFWSPSGVIWWRAHGPALVAMTVLYVTAWLLLGKAMRDAGLALQTGSLGWTALLRGRAPSYPPMPTTGLFRFTRQPIYVAFAMTLWTVPVWTPDQLTLAGVLTAYCVAAPKLKEARFRRTYGTEFDDYARGVPYWLPVRRKRGRSPCSEVVTGP